MAPEPTVIAGDVNSLANFADIIDGPTFEQILEMDDDEDEREFSKMLVLDFFEQARHTFSEMDQAIEAADLKALSDKGHFLKGSSATLGLTKVKDTCEKIQHWGSGNDEHGDGILSNSECLRLIKESVPRVKQECKEAETVLKKFYGEA